MELPERIFEVAEDVLAYYRQFGGRGGEAAGPGSRRSTWCVPPSSKACLAAAGLDGWADALPTWSVGDELATRQALEAVLAATVDAIPGLIGGGADLTGNTGTKLKGQALQSATEPGGRQIAFGVREHAMAAALVGLARHGGVVPFGGTFLVLSLLRPAFRAPGRRLRRSSCGATTRSVSGTTAPPTSRWSTSPPCEPSPVSRCSVRAMPPRRPHRSAKRWTATDRRR